MNSSAKNSGKSVRSFSSARRVYVKRLMLTLPPACLLCFTFFFFAPYEMVAFNSASFSYHHSDILLPLLLSALCTSLCLSLVVSLLRGKLFKSSVSVIFATALCIYVQAGFFNGSIGALTGDAIDWSTLKTKMIFNLAFWLLVYAAVFLLQHFRQRLWRSAVVYASVVLIFMQSVPSACILFGAYEGTQRRETNSYSLQTSGMYEFSASKNVLVFVLDRMDYDCIDEVLAEDPHALDFLDGFIQYDNAVSPFARTKPALAQLLTGCVDIAYRTSPDTYFKECWQNGENRILNTIHAQGYTIDLYATLEELFSDPRIDAQHVANLSDGNDQLIPLQVIKRMAVLSCYRFAPIAAKPVFFRDTNYYNAGVYVGEPYTINDGKHGAGFARIEASRTAPCFKLYHFQGSHPPYFLTASGTSCDYPTSSREQTLGCFRLLKIAFDRMKALGLYEDATIIITADHGNAISDAAPLQKATRIGLFYKASGSADSPLQISHAPVSTQNIPATLLKSMGADYSAYDRPLDEIKEGDEPLRIFYKPVTSKDDYGEYGVNIYHISADASEFSGWNHVQYLDIPPECSFY